MKILVSAGETSSDLYASLLVAELRKRWPEAEFFGCTGPRMRDEGVCTVVDAHSLAVVGLVEVLHHIPRIYGEFRKIVTAAEREKPAFAILADSPDFHLRLAKKLKRLRIPVVYLVAPQVWAWRKGRLPLIRRVVDQLLCIFPFEQQFFRQYGVSATYIGHPLAQVIRPKLGRSEFFRKHRLDESRPLVTVLPGSRRGEAGRHLPVLVESVDRIYRRQAVSFVLPASQAAGSAFFRERIGDSPIKVLEGESWDAIAHSDLALAASGTVTVEAALLGTPMVTFYRVTGLSWLMGKLLVRVPFYSMVNLIAERKIVPELMQADFTAEALSDAALRLIEDSAERDRQRRDLAEVAARLTAGGDAMARAAALIEDWMEGQVAHVS